MRVYRDGAMEAAAPWQQSLRAGSSCDDVLAALGASPGALAGQTLLLTGATAGIGRALAAALAPLGPTLVCGCRSEEKAEALAEQLRPAGAPLFTPRLDLADLRSVRTFAAEINARVSSGEWPPLRALVLNAGVMHQTSAVAFGEGGVEDTFGTNHLAHFHLTELLLPLLRAAAPSRVVVVGSHSHFGPLATDKKPLGAEERPWLEDAVYPSAEEGWGLRRGLAAYGSSKLANTLFAAELHRREAGEHNRLRTTCLAGLRVTDGACRRWTWSLATARAGPSSCGRGTCRQSWRRRSWRGTGWMSARWRRCRRRWRHRSSR